MQRNHVIIGLILLGVIFLAISLPLGLFWVAKSATQDEWNSKVSGRRTPAEIKGIMDAMVRYNQEPPNFLPQSGLDDHLCAATVINAMNFIVGEDLLQSVPAWFFQKTNQDKLTLVFDRSDDFTVEGSSVVEKKDRGFWLSKILPDPNGMYVLGYLYRDSVAMGTLAKKELGATLNSHLMLLLPKVGEHRWGFHLFHAPGKEHLNPVLIERLDDRMAKDFDLIYIWQIKGIELPEKGEDMFVVNDSLPYEKVHSHLNNGPEFLEYYLDTIAVWWLNFGRYEQFPDVVKLHDGVVKVPLNGKVFHGKVLGFYKKVPIYYHGHETQARSNFGQTWQCVEYANRFFVKACEHRNLERTGHADSYFWKAKAKGLESYLNGSLTAPQPDDLLIFDKSDSDGKVGHIAVITSVDKDKVCFVQQNFGKRWYDCLPVVVSVHNWYIEAGKPYPALVAGWVRAKNNAVNL